MVRIRRVFHFRGRRLLLAGLLPLFGVPLPAQVGLTPEWEIRKTIDSIKSQSQAVLPVLEQVKPGQWIEQGAPSAYQEQAESIRKEIGYLNQTADSLSQRPDSMKITLETYLRLQSLQSMLNSLTEGVRRYQNPALADLLQGIIGESGAAESRLREYLVELVSTKEDELRIADSEAQRCRGMLIRQPGARPAERRPKP